MARGNRNNINNSSDTLARPDTTRERLLLVAEELFAKKGFLGASIREIGATLGVANSSILYHFHSKERLYAAILKRIAASIRAATDDLLQDSSNPSEQIQVMMERLLDWTQANTCYTQIIVRELMENSDRLARARHLYLAEVVKAMRSPLEKMKGEGKLRSFDPALFLIHLIGSVSYFSIAIPTISHITGNSDTEDLRRKYKETLLQVIKSCVAD